MARKKNEPTLSKEEYAEWLSHQEVVERDGATYIIVDGVEYPVGVEPNPALTGRDLLHVLAEKDERQKHAVGGEIELEVTLSRQRDI